MTNKLISLVIIIFFLSVGRSYSEEQFLFPKEKPSIFKKINKNPGKSFSSNLPQKKPITNQEKEQKKDVNQKQKVVIEDKKVDLKEKKEVKKVEVIKKRSSFVLPQKKPSIYKSKIKTAEKSSILNQKDFERAKETIQFIKDKKWNSALKSSAKVKDREFRTLITWMHLKTTRNGASFAEYKKFIEQNEDLSLIHI